jgi:hypothetical protein
LAVDVRSVSAADELNGTFEAGQRDAGIRTDRRPRVISHVGQDRASESLPSWVKQILDTFRLSQ